MSLTRKHFKAIAEIIRPFFCPQSDIKRIFCENLADYFATENERFDRNKFLKACGVLK